VRYFKGVLCSLGAVSFALLVPSLWWAFRGMSSEKATGLAAVAGGLVEIIISPIFWILAILSFLFFRWASRNGHTLARLLLFWIPSVAFSMLGITILSLFTYLYLRFRHS
jgi:uncharacterized membrane protein YidH (DUF202 family)